jgi:hypothetical protein
MVQGFCAMVFSMWQDLWVLGIYAACSVSCLTINLNTLCTVCLASEGMLRNHAGSCKVQLCVCDECTFSPANSVTCNAHMYVLASAPASPGVWLYLTLWRPRYGACTVRDTRNCVCSTSYGQTTTLVCGLPVTARPRHVVHASSCLSQLRHSLCACVSGPQLRE